MKRNIYAIFKNLFPLILVGKAMAFDHSHALFDKILNETVVQTENSTRVRYKDIKKSPALLEQYLASLSAVNKAEYENFKKNEKLAFLINVYNAFTLKLIVDNYPVKSIKDLGGMFSSPWKRKFFKLFGEEFFLDRIEHDMIRKDFDEPRIHFAVNCASKGCPPLASTAYVAAKLDEQLEQAAIKFLSDSKQNRWNPSKRKFEVSSIFKWYGSDFDKKFMSHGVYIAKKMGLPDDVVKDAQAGKIPFEYLDYDWSLNDAN